MKSAITEDVPSDLSEAVARWEDEGGAFGVPGGLPSPGQAKRIELTSGFISPFAVPAIFIASTAR